MSKALLQLGDLRWRVNPNSVDWTFQLDTARIQTIGGQVVQILGSTLSDLVITGDFGQDNGVNTHQVSWQLANAFHRRIRTMMDAQAQPAKTAAQSTATKQKKTATISDTNPVHRPWVLTYRDGVHDWSFKVLIKSIEDPEGGSINHRTGKFAYKYRLTLFVVQADSDLVRSISSDYFLTRMSQGLGWKKSTFNGPQSAKIASDFIIANGGSITAFLDKVLTGGQA